MNILIAGGSGFIGQALAKKLSKEYQLTLLSRKKQIIDGYSNTITWAELTESSIEQFDVVINLCGYSIAENRWRKNIKEKIIQSRIAPTKRLVQLIGSKDIWLINASAIGYYPYSTQMQTEDKFIYSEEKDFSFSQKVTHQWEATVKQSDLKKYTILRFGVVLGKDGGMFKKLLLPTKFGAGVIIGNGNQLLTWIHIKDLVSAVHFIIQHQYNDHAIFNITAPNACTQKSFIKTLARALHRPQLFFMPAFVVKSIFGQMGEELLLSSHDIKPAHLKEKGFQFQYDDIKLAINELAE
ncbi:TIGR01777 family oxidoreductase [Thiotrichales bacterium 19S11-10]|nr:TIGR01777 family oxidoreductase [Thiotrichales bacterium 19S11-10]